MPLEIKTVSVNALMLDPQNARRHPKVNIDAIKESLERFGQVAPIVVRKGVVVGGNGTLTAAQALGWDELEVVEFEGTLRDAKSLALALNRTAELAEWNTVQLAETLAELGAEASGLGFTAEDLDLLVGDLQPPAVIIDDSTPSSDESLPSNQRREKPEPSPQYALLFDDEGQQKRFFEFLARLEGLYPDARSAAEKLDLLARAVFPD